VLSINYYQYHYVETTTATAYVYLNSIFRKDMKQVL